MLSENVIRAIKWLDTVTDPDGGVHRWVNLETGELGPVSTEITGYAAHLFAWLTRETSNEDFGDRASKHTDWIVRLLRDNSCRFLPFEPGSDLMYFFDTGIAIRALEMNKTWSSIGKWMDYRKPIINRMQERIIPKPGWWSSEPGHYQAKARLSDFTCIAGLPWAEWNGDGNLLHPLAYFVEAAYLSGNNLVAAMGLEMLYDHIYSGQVELLRTDVMAQMIRLAILMPGESNRYLPIDELTSVQHASGGFHFAMNSGRRSPDLSTHATIFAIQALMMAEGHTTDYKELTIV